MTNRHCAYCNATASPEHPLLSCGACKKVAYCNRDCQKLHWKTHKPMCFAATNKPNKVTGSGDKDKTIMTPDGHLDEHGNAVIDGKTCPPGSYLKYFVLPTPGFPRGHMALIGLDPPVAIWLASLPEEEREEYERYVIEGFKSGRLDENGVPKKEGSAQAIWLDSLTKEKRDEYERHRADGFKFGMPKKDVSARVDKGMVADGVKNVEKPPILSHMRKP
jgi:hypothetical protein